MKRKFIALPTKPWSPGRRGQYPVSALSEYLDKTNTPISEFAEKCGLSPDGLRKILKGGHAPQRDTSDKIEKATNGKVTRADLLAMAV